MVVIMVVIVAMTMMVVIVVVVMMLVRRRRIGAALGLERRVDGNDLGAEASQQRLDRRIALEPQPTLQHLHRHMPVAEMPGEPRQRRQIGGAHLDQWLGLRHHLDQPAIVEHQRVVGAQPHRLGKIKLDAGALDAEQEALLRLALRVGKDERVDGGRVRAVRQHEERGWRVAFSIRSGGGDAAFQLRRAGRSGSSAGCGGSASGVAASGTTLPAPRPSRPCADTPGRRPSRAAGRRDSSIVPIDSTHHG